MDIRSDRQKGLSYVELGRKYHMDQRTAKRYAESPRKPRFGSHCVVLPHSDQDGAGSGDTRWSHPY